MKLVLMALLAALLLAACGGGSDAGPSSVVALNAQRAGMPATSASAELLAGNISLVNTTTAGPQQLRALGAGQDGGYTVAWISGDVLYLQRYDSAGVRQGGETLISLSIQADSAQRLSAAIASAQLAVLGDGSVVVAYRVSRTVVQADGAVSVSQAVYFQRFDANGVQVMAETQVSPSLALVASRSPFIGDLRIAALADGGFVVGWTVASFSAQFGFISTLSVQRYDSGGQPVGGAVSLGQFATLNFSITADARGGYTVVARYVDAGFNPLLSVVHFNADQTFTQILTAAPGAFALLLPLENRYLLFVSGPAGAYEQVLDNQSAPVGEQTSVVSMPVAATELADGTYVLIWPNNDTFTARRFDSTDNPMGRSFTLQTAATAPQVVALTDGGFALAWSDAGAAGDTDVFTQVFSQTLGALKQGCLERARGLNGQARKAAVRACLA